MTTEFLHLANEILLHFFEQLPLYDLLAFYHVNRRCRYLVPSINEPLHRQLLQSAIRDIDQYPDGEKKESFLVGLTDRISYVTEVEGEHKIRIPEPYRTVLMEWPSKRPLPDSHWPHAVRFHANGFCSCFRNLYDGVCQCKSSVYIVHSLAMEKTVLEEIRRGGPFDNQINTDSRWELFRNPPRLYTKVQNAQTIRFILAHPTDTGMWHDKFNSAWTRLNVPLLRLSRYESIGEDNSFDEGDIYIILDGPTKGQIHAWDSFSWYKGFEANTFLEWRYEEWQPYDPEQSDVSDEDNLVA